MCVQKQRLGGEQCSPQGGGIVDDSSSFRLFAFSAQGKQQTWKAGNTKDLLSWWNAALVRYSGNRTDPWVFCLLTGLLRDQHWSLSYVYTLILFSARKDEGPYESASDC